MVGKLQPLVNNQRIVGPDGLPTEYFIRWAQQRQIDIGDAIDEDQAIEIVEQFLADHPLIAGSGINFTPSGNIADDVTISAEVQAILNQISSTQGTVLFRGATDWQGLAPGTPGFVLSTNGAGADPSWIAQSGGGGGGGGVPTFKQSKGVALASMAVGITLDSPPDTGDLLLAILFNATQTVAPTLAGGWTTVDTNTTLPDHAVAFRIAGAGESATQAPASTIDGGVILMFVFSGATRANAGTGASTGTATSISQSLSGTQWALLECTSGLMVGYSGRRTDEAGTMAGSFTNDEAIAGPVATVGGTGVSVVAGYATKTPGASLPSSTCNWPTSAATKTGLVIVC